jgi:DNA-directed RNA polymerase subunit RPC12/RpoP
MEKSRNCSICGKEFVSRERYDNIDSYEIECETCGVYRISHQAEKLSFTNMQTYDSKKLLISAYLREMTDKGESIILITTDNIPEIINRAERYFSK